MQYLFLFMQPNGEAAAAAASPATTQAAGDATAAATTEQSDKVGATTAAKSGSLFGGGSSQFLLFMVLIFVVMYFFMIRPQQKRQKEMAKFRDSLQKGQKVITAGGIYGTVKEVKDGYVMVDIDTNTTIRIAKSMVMRDTTDLQQQR